MVGKKGFMRIMEATIAVLIILGALFVIASQRETKSRQDLTDILRKLLDEVAKNQEMRQKVVDYQLCDYPYDCRKLSPDKEILTNLSLFLEERIKNPAFNYSISICRANSVCSIQEAYPVDSTADIYAAERIITTTVSGETPGEIKKIKLFLWRRI